jgi:hypothetical protein
MQWIWKYRFHLVAWSVMITYLLNANALYTALFLTQGKPVRDAGLPPQETGEVIFAIDAFEETVVQGEEVYRISGWVFAPDLSASGAYHKKIVLHSARENVVFAAETVTRPKLNDALARYAMDVSKAGFSAYIARAALKRGDYRIGFLLEDPQGQTRVYALVDRSISREANQLRLVGQ